MGDRADAVRAALRGRLIVSVQAEAGSPLGDPATIALLARAVVGNGAAGVRIEGAERIRAVRAAVDVPIVGIVKRSHAGFEPYITSTFEEIAEAADAGADVVAFDATARPRAGGADVAGMIGEIERRGLLAMADCSDENEGFAAAAAGAGIVATTLAGYTQATAGRPLPALDLVAAYALRHTFVICEGGIQTPDAAAAAFRAGAAAIVVGTAITNVDALTRRFAAVAPGATDHRT
jgi:N-acylglucosamine-6-phosphate 2-epimerase